MNPISSSPKPKFFPPIKTAASFLRTICKSPEYSTLSPNTNSYRELPSDFKTEKSWDKLKTSKNLMSRITISREHSFNPDSEQLNKILRTPEQEQNSLKSFYLPTSVDKLKSLAKVGKNLGKQVKINLAPCEPKITEWLLKENSFEEKLEKLTKRRGSENSQLRDWLEYMKKEDSKDSEKFKTVLNVTLHEILKSLGFDSDLASVVKDYFVLVKGYKKGKFCGKLKKIMDQNAIFEQNSEIVERDLEKVRIELNQIKENNMQEMSVLKSNLMLKNIEIESLQESIKFLKAERMFRIKKDLEKMNEILNEFCEYKKFNNKDKADRPNEEKIREDNFKEIILKKLSLIKEKSSAEGARLSEEQLIEHEMLFMNQDSVFINKEVQVYIPQATLNKSTSIQINTADQGVLTDEILDFVEEQESIEAQELLKQPSITIFNENQEEVQFSIFSKNANDISVVSLPAESQSLALSPTKAPHRRISSLFKWRESNTKSTQTEEKVFKQAIRQQEEEILDWMINDRKSYLSNIQKQIFQTKNELNKVNTLVHHSKSMLSESLSNDLKRQNSFLSCDENEDFIESEINYLVTAGLLNRDTEKESWKNGFIYGYEKAKSIVEDEKTVVKEDEGSIHKEEKIKDFFKAGKKSARKNTKVQEFNFHGKERRISRSPTTEIIKKENFIEDFIKEPSKNIIKQAKMSRKVTIKTINSLFSTCIVKKNNLPNMDLFSWTYEEFNTRYGSQIATKKLIEFFSSVLKYPDSRKTINFAKLLGISNKIGLEDYARPKETFHFLISLMNLLQKSKLGIVFNVEENIEYEFIPVIRAVECTKEILFGFFENVKISNIISDIEANSHPDPKKINKCGLIDQEFFIEMLVGEIDRYYYQAKKVILKVLQALYRSKSVGKVFRQDLIISIKYISPEKFSLIFGTDKITTDPIDQTLNLATEDFITFCLSNKVLTPKNLEDFLKDCSAISDRIKNEENSIKNNLTQIFENKELLNISQKYAIEWQKRLEYIISDNPIDDIEKSIIWQIITLEASRNLVVLNQVIASKV